MPACSGTAGLKTEEQHSPVDRMVPVQVSMLPGAVTQQDFERGFATQDKDTLTITYWYALCAGCTNFFADV